MQAVPIPEKSLVRLRASLARAQAAGSSFREQYETIAELLGVDVALPGLRLDLDAGAFVIPEAEDAAEPLNGTLVSAG